MVTLLLARQHFLHAFQHRSLVSLEYPSTHPIYTYPFHHDSVSERQMSTNQFLHQPPHSNWSRARLCTVRPLSSSATTEDKPQLRAPLQNLLPLLESFHLLLDFTPISSTSTERHLPMRMHHDSLVYLTWVCRLPGYSTIPMSAPVHFGHGVCQPYLHVEGISSGGDEHSSIPRRATDCATEPSFQPRSRQINSSRRIQGRSILHQLAHLPVFSTSCGVSLLYIFHHHVLPSRSFLYEGHLPTNLLPTSSRSLGL